MIANLAIFFAVHPLFREVNLVEWGPVHFQVPEVGTLKPLSLAVALFAGYLLLVRKWSILRTLAICALIGLAAGLVDMAVSCQPRIEGPRFGRCGG